MMQATDKLRTAIDLEFVIDVMRIVQVNDLALGIRIMKRT